MAKKYENVFQFKITLTGSKPPIWRRIIVPEDYTFWDLHVAIQDSMGWTDTHLHEFEITNPKSGKKESIGIPDKEYDRKVLEGWKRKLSDYFTDINKKANYIYDFGDNWNHSIVLEKILPRETKAKYPICIGGDRSCPPEDCGGIWGYEEFIEAIMDPKHENYHQYIEWAGGNFNPEHFNVKAVIFENPKKRLKLMLGD